jgi:penicillin amidase
MIVQLGPEIQAWGVYPGGQSGDPGSPYYDNMIEHWRTGEYYKLNFLKGPDDGQLGEVISWNLRND